MSDPKITATQKELQDFARDWMLEFYGKPRDLSEEAKDRWHERYGFILSVLSDLFERGITIKDGGQ